MRHEMSHSFIPRAPSGSVAISRPMNVVPS
jgi:hypothetical protein